MDLGDLVQNYFLRSVSSAVIGVGIGFGMATVRRLMGGGSIENKFINPNDETLGRDLEWTWTFGITGAFIGDMEIMKDSSFIPLFGSFLQGVQGGIVSAVSYLVSELGYEILPRILLPVEEKLYDIKWDLKCKIYDRPMLVGKRKYIMHKFPNIAYDKNPKTLLKAYSINFGLCGCTQKVDDIVALCHFLDGKRNDPYLYSMKIFQTENPRCTPNDFLKYLHQSMDEGFKRLLQYFYDEAIPRFEIAAKEAEKFERGEIPERGFFRR
jgi:hypothetical protein